MALPGLRSGADGTVTELEVPLKPYDFPLKPGSPSWIEWRVPLWVPTESYITVPEVSSMCQRATVPVDALARAEGDTPNSAAEQTRTVAIAATPFRSTARVLDRRTICFPLCLDDHDRLPSRAAL